MTDQWFSSVQNIFYTIVTRFLLAKTKGSEMESWLKNSSKTVLSTILVSLMMIETTVAIPDEGGVYNNDARPVIVFRSQSV